LFRSAQRNSRSGVKGGAVSGELKPKSRAVQIGDWISDWVSKLFAHPYVQVGVILFCVLWFGFGLRADLLTAALSILAITLTQMVLNGQYDREAEAHRRDVAMHAKLDELLISMKGARNELAGIEDLEEAEIEELKQEVAYAIEDAGPAAGDRKERSVAERAAQKAVNVEVQEKKAKPSRSKASPAGKSASRRNVASR
jgi:low affinity Fe/Cu permease